MGENPARILCLGEVTWDHLLVTDRLPDETADGALIRQSEGAGGSALNTACILKSLNVPVTLGGNSIGNDSAGYSIATYLKSREIDQRLFQTDETKTPLCYVFVEESTGRRSFIISHDHIQNFYPQQLGSLVEETKKNRFSHVFAQPYTRQLSGLFLKAVQDVENLWILIQDVDTTSSFVELADGVQISLPEGHEFNEFEAEKVSKDYIRGRCQTVFLTAGARGVALCQDGLRPVIFPGLFSKEVRDTTGCGDAFRAGLMAGLYKGQKLEEAVGAGQQVALKKATLYGSHF